MSFPFYGEEFTFTQPDGTPFKVRGWGDQHYAVFETLDGYTVVEDPATGFYHYASSDAHLDALVPTGSIVGDAAPEHLNLTPGIRLNQSAIKAQVLNDSTIFTTPSRWEVRREQFKTNHQAAMFAAGVEPVSSGNVIGEYVGLCLLIQFPDVPGTITQEEVDAFCNQRGYSGFRNRGSVYDYFLDNSGGKLHYTNIVTPYYTAKKKREYYADEKIPLPFRTYELIGEALSHLKSQGFDFSQLTTDDEGLIYALNVFYAGPRVNAWRKGLWPHSYHLLFPNVLAPGKRAFDYQITNMGNQLTLGTFCHENGHLLCDFPDLYDYGRESRGVGKFCLMGSGGNANPRNPTNICAYLKHQAGWSDSVIELSSDMNGSLTAGQNDFYLHRKNLSEYFIIENRHRSGRDSAIPDSGLAIWHVDEQGSNNNEQMTPDLHYECSLIQADGEYHLEKGQNRGDAFDLFSAGGNNRFSDTSNPESHWWDGTSSGLEIFNIGPIGKTIKFSANVTNGNSLQPAANFQGNGHSQDIHSSVPLLDVTLNNPTAWEALLAFNAQRAEVDLDEVERVLELARRTPGLAQYESSLQQLSRALRADTKLLQQHRPEQLTELIKFWERYRAAVIQRYTAVTPVELRAADKIVNNIFDRFIRRIPSEKVIYDPDVKPLVYGGEGGPSNYFTHPPSSGLPFAIINLPHSAFDQVWQWLALPHETGHDLYASVLGLREELEQALSDAMRQAVQDGTVTIPDVHVDLSPFGAAHTIDYTGEEFLVKVWQGWANEAQADIVGYLNCGPAAIVSLQQILGFRTADLWVVQGDGSGGFIDFPEEHPTDYVRNKLAIAALRSIDGGSHK